MCAGQHTILRVHCGAQSRKVSTHDSGLWSGNKTTCGNAYENGVLCNGQHPGSTVNSVIDQGEFEFEQCLVQV